MARIGILTFSNTLNYGAAMQCYALTTYLKGQGHDISVIDYRNNRIEKKGKRCLSSIRNFKDMLLYLITKRNFLTREKLFDEFNCNYLPMTVPIEKNNVKEVLSKYDVVIVGSDQVWNGLLTDNDYTYYLPFDLAGVGKISYAASFGKGIPDEKEWVKISSYLKQFDKISVREESAKELIKKEARLSCEVVCDPTFLLDSEAWLDLSTKGKCRKGDYVLCYILSQRERVINRGKQVAAQLGVPLICIQTGTIHSTFGAEDIRAASPLDFLALFSQARYVVTDSFHGTCFSILFQRDFSSILSNSEGANSRIESLLDTLGLSDRYKTNEIKPIDYAKVSYRKNRMVNEARSFLNLSLADYV